MSERERRGAGRQDAVPGKGGVGATAGAPGRTTLVEQAYAIQRKATGLAPVAGAGAAVAGTTRPVRSWTE